MKMLMTSDRYHMPLDARIKSGHDGGALSLPGLTRQSRATGSGAG